MARPLPSPPSPDPADLAAGRLQTLLVLGLIFVLVVSPTVIALAHGGVVEQPGGKLAGFAVTLFVLWNVYRGSLIALFVTLALSGLGGLFLMLLSPLGGFSLRTLEVLLVGLVFAICAAALYAHGPIKAFLLSQRQGGSRRAS